MKEVLPAGAAETALVRLNLATMFVLRADYEAADDNFQRAMLDLNGDPAVDEDWLEETADAFNEVEETWELELRADELMDEARAAESKLNYGMALEALDQAFSGYRTAPLARDQKLAELFEMQARLLKRTGGDKAEITRLLRSVSVIRAEEKARGIRIAELAKSLPAVPET